MTKFESLAMKLRARPFSVMLLLVTLVLMFMLFVSQISAEDTSRNKQLRQYGESLLLANQSRLAHQVSVYRDWLQSIVASPSTRAMLSGEGLSPAEWQQQLKQLVPGLQHACIFEQELLTPESDCMPLSYVSLDVMRSLDENPNADLVLINKAPDPAHILLATALNSTSRPQPLKLMLAFEPKVLLDGMIENPVSGIYLEMVQGQDSAKALKSFGDVSLKQGTPHKVQSVAGSQWQFRLWTGAANASHNWSFPLSILFLIAIAWLIREWWYNRTLRHDSEILEEQLSDLQQLKMRNFYPVINTELGYISQTIYQIGIPQRNKQPVRVDSEPTLTVEENTDASAETAPGEESSPESHASVEDEYASATPAYAEPEPEVDGLIDVDETETRLRDDVIEYDQISPDDARQASLEARNKTQSDEYETRQQDELVDFDSSIETIDIDNLEPEDETQTLDFIEDQPDDELTQAEQTLSAELNAQDTATAKSDGADDVLPHQAIFRKYDIRGVVGEQLTVPVMRQLGRAVGSMLVESNIADLNVGCDARLSSAPLTKAFIRGVLSTGCNVYELGQVPTPLIYYANVISDVRSGVIITGSHNPTDFNGLKLVINGKALLGDEIQAVYQRIKEGRFSTGKGMLQQVEYFNSYLQKVQEEIRPQGQLSVVVDCGNSIAGQFLPRLLRGIGCKVIELFCEVDGRFPNHHPDPGQPENLVALQQMVKSNKADLGIAVDGDADRLGVVDNEGKIIWPDRLLALFARDLLARQPGATVLFDVKCSKLISDVVREAGGQEEMVASGHSVIKAEMQRTGAILAGEMTGHFFFKDRWYGFDDGMYAACRLVELLSSATGASAEVFAAIPEYQSTPEIIVRMTETDVHAIVARFAEEYDADQATVTTIDGVRIDFADGWGLLRASNTMPAISLRFEAQSRQRLDAIKQSFLETLQQISPRSRFKF